MHVAYVIVDQNGAVLSSGANRRGNVIVPDGAALLVHDGSISIEATTLPIAADQVAASSVYHFDGAELSVVSQPLQPAVLTDAVPSAADLARAYLAETDWYVTRQVETGTPIPDDIAAARAEARATAST